MANYQGSARSNYVKFNDRIHHILVLFPDLTLTHSREVPGLDALLSSCEYGTPDATSSEDYDEDDEAAWKALELDPEEDFPALLDIIHTCLVDEPDNVFVWMHAGAEKLRYLSGGAMAIDHTGIIKQVSLYDIYEGQPNWSRAEY